MSNFKKFLKNGRRTYADMLNQLISTELALLHAYKLLYHQLELYYIDTYFMTSNVNQQQTVLSSTSFVSCNVAI